MNKYEVTYKVAGCKYEFSYIIYAINALHARKQADILINKEVNSRHAHQSTKQINEVKS